MKDKKYATLPDAKEVGERIRALRKKKKMTQNAFASNCMMTEKRLRGIEKGEFSPSLEEINEIAKYCQIDAVAFIAPQANEAMNAKISYVERAFEEKLAQMERDYNDNMKEMHELVDESIKALRF